MFLFLYAAHFWVDFVKWHELICFSYQSHKWIVYVQEATSEDLSVIIKRFVFQLHPSFNNPTSAVESAPFEVSESGWGEFEIAISLFFHNDVCDKQLDL